jgi:hypothetical protein
LTTTCAEPLIKKLEYQMPDDTWVTAWQENKYYDYYEDSTLQVIDGVVISFYLSQDEYFKSA